MINISGLKCEHQRGYISSCLSAYDYCNVFIYNSAFGMNTGSVASLWNNSHLVVISSSFFNNSTPKIGGAIYSYHSTIDIFHSVFYHNKVIKGGGSSILQFNSTGNLINCSFHHNISPTEGGAILLDRDCVLNVSHTIFLTNYGGLGGAVSVVGSLLVVINCSFSYNAAAPPWDYDTNPVYMNYSMGAGGAIHIVASVLKLYQSQFYNSIANNLGGSVSSSASLLSIHDTIFENNIAGTRGGGSYLCS